MKAKKLSPKEKIQNVAINLCSGFPFYGRCFCCLKWAFDDNMPMKTAATDGENIWFDSDFVDKMSEKQLAFVILHEIHHLIKKHIFRRRTRKPMLWNIACDHQINLELKKHHEKLEPPPIEICADPKYDGWFEEQIYSDLEKNPPPNYASYQDGCGTFIEGIGVSPEELNRRIDKMIEGAAKIAKDRGNLPGYLSDFIIKNRESTISWKSKLRRIVAPVLPKNPSWNSPNRRMVHHGWYIPSIIKDGVGKIAILGDTSGSMSDEEVNVIFSELNAILSECTPDECQFILFDSEPYYSEVLRAGQSLDLSNKRKFEVRRGGTHFAAAFKAIQGDPKIVIVVTDMECYFNDIEIPRCPVVWVATTDQVAPFGETIKVEV